LAYCDADIWSAERDEVPTFATPGEAALAGWRDCPTAHARVVTSTVGSKTAMVVVDTVPSHFGHVQCVRAIGGWFEIGSDS
jgi:hypothetical protein